jgi:transcriptional regulator with XRE-family HTH domain
MDYLSSLSQLGTQLAQMRKARGLTQSEVAFRAGIPRLKVIHVEAGRPTVAVEAYARVAAALGAGIQAVPARRPTIDEIAEILK